MKKSVLIVLGAVLCAAFGYGQAAGVQRQPQSPASAQNTARPAAAATQRALLDQYCVTCHSERLKTGGLSLEAADLSRVSANAEVWEKVVRKLRAGMMPPVGLKRPDNATREALTVWLENELDRSATPNLDKPAVHRMNRTEYADVVRDMLGLEIDSTTLLPADDSSNGFDNMAGTLGVSSALLQAYVSAAGKISRLAVGHATNYDSKMYTVLGDTTQDYHVEGLPFGTRGGLAVTHNFPADGEYLIKVQALRDNCLDLFGGVKGEKLELLLDGQRVALFDWDNDLDARVDAGSTKPDLRTRVPVKAGPHVLGATFLARNYGPNDDLNKPFLRSTLETGDIVGFTFYPHIGSVSVEGPFNATPAKDTPSRAKIFSCNPTNATGESACAKQIISRLARQAFRRPSTDEDLESLMGAYDEGRRKGNFEDGVEMALRTLLADPEFVFRVEADPPNVKSGQAFRISDVELASRLSFFLWSTIPDDELMGLATQGKLKDARVLEQQVRRMLADPRSDALVTNFAGQWLQLRTLPAQQPLQHLFPDFDDNLRQAMRRETELFFESIIREDRNVVDLLTADYTFVNERLAKHYGIPNIYGDHFRRITLGPDMDARRGLLGKGAILLVSALADRTSPVYRGKWVLLNVLDTIPPDPPPNVPALKQSKQEIEQTTEVSPSMRERMEEHRANPACASCHKIMDPIGFSLENFDASGKWRTEDGGRAIDASVELFDNSKISGPVGLRQALLAYSPQFLRGVTEKLMTYALGRGVEYKDMPVVRSIVRDAGRNNNRFSAIVLGIVKSAPFQMRTKSENTAASR